MDKITLRRKNLRTAIDAALKNDGFKSDVAFCEHYDLNPSHISQLINGHGSFGERAARNLEKKAGWPEGLLDQEPETDSFDGDLKKAGYGIEIYEDGDPVPDGYIPIDYYDDVYVSAGSGYLNLEKPSAKKILFPADLIKECNVQPNTTKVIRVRGESMFPKLKDGQAISVDMSAKTIYDGEIYAFQVGDDTKIKYLSNWNDEGKGGFKAVSANSDKNQYPDEYFSPARIEAEGVFVIGQYWWKQVVKRIRR